MINAKREALDLVGNKEERDTEEGERGVGDASRYTNNDLHSAMGTNSGR